MKKIKEILDNDKTGKKVLILQIIGVFVLTLGFTLALNYISKSINASLATANINVIYVGDSNITKDLFLPITANETSTKAAIANFTVKGAESNPTDKDIIYDITLTNIDITDGLLDENFKFELYKNNTKISEGNFSNLQVENSNGTLKYYQRAILNENVMNLPRYNETADSFQIRIYILDNGKDQSNLMGQSFKANVEIATYTTKGGSTNRNRYTNLITIKNDFIINSNIGNFRRGIYNVSTSCNNAESSFNKTNWEFRIKNLTGYSTCNATFTEDTNTYPKLYDKIISLWNNTDGTNNIFKETHTFDDNTTYTEYRYEGTDTEVNNYVWFNNELWRIIGAFPGGTPTTSETSLGNRAPSTNNTVKIIRNDVIGSFAWDKDNTNNWTTAELNTNILNNLYLNSTSGTCNFDSTSVTKPCSFTKNGLKNVLDYIETATWNLGASEIDKTAEVTYKTERGTTVYTSGTPIVTTAKVGLMYASDYGYSVKNSSCNHSSKSLYYYNATACGGSAWMLKNGYEWTLSPLSRDASEVLYVSYYAGAGYFLANIGYGARPVLYLNSNVYYLSGTGTITDPFQIALGN